MGPESEQKSRENDRLRHLLKGMGRRRAPWYFQAELRRRLTRKPRRGISPVRLVPAFALSTISVLFVGVVIYFLLPLSAELPGEFPEGGVLPFTDSTRSEEPVIEERAPSELPSFSGHETDGGEEGGPSGAKGDPVRETLVITPGDDDRNPESLPVFQNSSSVLSDTFGASAVVSDSADTLKDDPDSLQQPAEMLEQR